MTKFSAFMDIRVYYEDTDHGGVVYYANYLKFMERARSEFLRSAGLELDVIERDFSVLFAVTEAHVLYHAPALFNDLLTSRVASPACTARASASNNPYSENTITNY